MKKYLPIKFYQKREITDDRLTNAGGSKDDPSWVLHGESLEERAGLLSTGIDDIIKTIEIKPDKYDYIPSIIAVELDENAVAKTHRNSIKEIFNQERDKNNVIGFNNENELLIKVDSVNDATKIKRKLNNSIRYAKGISAITNIAAYQPIIENTENSKDRKIIKVSLFNYFDYSLNQAVKSAFHDLCKENNIISKEVFYTNDLIIFRLENVESNEQYLKLEEFPAIEYIIPMPQFKISNQEIKQSIDIELEKPKPDKEYPVVGILDGGIEQTQQLSEWIIGSNNSYPDELLDKSHGTFIGGIVTYGDSLEGKIITGVNGCKIFDAAVFPDTNKENITEDELIENIRENIKSHPEIKIWNMSLGYECMEADSDNFSAFAMVLDDIQQQYNIIICKSAGNCSNFLSNRPTGRITIPVESIASLVVGSVGNDGTPSVFSRKGFGPANIHKPDLVSFGGNMIKVGEKYIMDGVKSFATNGSFVENLGTSFAAPRLATLLAGLDFKIAEEFDPLLLKALAIHSAKYPDTKLSQIDRVQLMGYGIPDTVENILYNSDYEITLIQSDRITKGSFMEILEFPYPESLIDQHGFYYGDVTVTLVTSPVLFAGNGAEYCQSDIDVKFGTFDEIKQLKITQGRRNEYGPDGFENLLMPDNYGRRFINADFDNPFTRERTLLKYGKKYQPVKKWHFNLGELTPANKVKYLTAPKKWGLRLTGLYRDFAETRAVIDGEQLFQDFCLIITIKDPNQEKMVYNEVAHLLESRSFIHNDITLRDSIQTQVRI